MVLIISRFAVSEAGIPTCGLCGEVGKKPLCVLRIKRLPRKFDLRSANLTPSPGPPCFYGATSKILRRKWESLYGAYTYDHSMCYGMAWPLIKILEILRCGGVAAKFRCPATMKAVFYLLPFSRHANLKRFAHETCEKLSFTTL